LHVEPFQATVLSLAGIIGAGFLATRLLSNIMSIPSRLMDTDDDYDEDDYDDDEYVDTAHSSPGIPRWRQPLKSVDFSKVGPDDRCPCGSGRKYKNCHGSKRGK
jgi:preprotein translocase subunit SecA